MGGRTAWAGGGKPCTCIQAHRLASLLGEISRVHLWVMLGTHFLPP